MPSVLLPFGVAVVDDSQPAYTSLESRDQHTLPQLGSVDCVPFKVCASSLSNSVSHDDRGEYLQHSSFMIHTR